MDVVRKLILERLTELGLDMSEVSRKIGRNHAYLQQFLKRGVPLELGEKDRAKLAQILDVPEERLRGTSPTLPTKEYARIGGIAQPSPQASVKSVTTVGPRMDNLVEVPATYGPHDLPVFGTAQAGQKGAQMLTSDAVDWVTRPEPLLRVKDGYGIIVQGDSMGRVVPNGSTAMVNPYLPPRSEDICIFRKTDLDGTVYIMIKEFVSMTETSWKVRQYNPEETFTLKRSEWQECHRVVSVNFP